MAQMIGEGDPVKTRISAPARCRDDWVDAGLAMMTEGRAVTIAAVSKDLSATKGSFYWHFKGLEEYIEVLTDVFLACAEARLIDPEPNAEHACARLLMRMSEDSAAELALRALAKGRARMTEKLARLDRRRIDALGMLIEDGASKSAVDVHRPQLIYSAWLGAPALEATLGAPATRFRQMAAGLM